MANIEILSTKTGIIIFDGYVNSVAFTDEAKKIIMSSDAIEMTDGYLHATDKNEDVHLQRVIADYARRDFAQEPISMSQRIAIKGKNSHLIMWFTALRQQSGFSAEMRVGSGALALISNSANFGFTDAEHSVAELLWRGVPLRKIAEQRGTSLETVRSQAKAIYAKMGVHRRSQMIGALAGRDLDEDYGLLSASSV